MINKNRQYRTYDDELPVFNEKDGGSATSWDDELPEFKDGKEVKKKGSGGLFSKVGSSVGVSGLQSTEVKNEKQVQLPEFKIEDYNRDFENITGHREFSLREPQKPTSLLGQERYEKKKKEFETEKFLKYSDIEQNKINPVLNNVSLGQTNAEELKQLHDSPYGKKIVNEVIDKEIPESVTDGEKDWEKLAFNINVKNRKNGVELKNQLLYNIDNELASSLNDASTQTTYVNAGTGGGMASTTVNKLPQIDTNNASELSEILQKIQSSDFLLDKNGNKVDKKGIEDKIKTKLFYLSTQEPISPEIYQLSDKINKAVTRANLERDRGENIPIEEYAKNDVINTTHFATGLNYIKYTDPARYKNILSAIDKRETIAGLDFESLSKIGQDIDNEKVYSASASDPSLIGAETNIKYDSYDTKKAEYSKILSEEIKKLGFKNSLKVPSVVIDLAAARHPELTNKEIIKDIKFDESSGGYGIVKGGFVNSFFRGVAQPIKSINETINALTQSPVDVYLNSRRLDYGDQKLIDSKGNVTESLPSERRNYFNKAIEGLGQFTTQVTLSYLIGGALGGTYRGITGKTLTQSQKVNLAAYGGGGVSTLAQTYGQEYADFLNKTANPDKASLMAFISSLGQSFLEVGILPDVKIAESIKGLLKNPSRELAKGIVDVITKGGGEEAAKPFIQRYVNNIANLYGKEILTEEVLQNVTNYLTEAIFSPKTADNRDISKETIDVISDATVSFAIPTILGALGNSKTDKQITKDAIHSGGINFNLYKDAFEKAVEKGVLSEQEKDEALNILSIHKESLDNVPKRDSKGELISTERQLEYAYQNTVAKMNESKLSQTDDEVQKEHLEKKIKEANDIKRKIFGGEENKDLPPQKDEYTTEEISKQEVQAAKILATANLPDIYQQQAEQDPIGTLREIAEQAQGFTTDSNGNPIKQEGGGRRDDLVRMGIPESVINKAIEMFPTPFKEEVSTGEQPSTEIKEEVKPITEEQPTVSEPLEGKKIGIKNNLKSKGFDVKPDGVYEKNGVRFTIEDDMVYEVNKGQPLKYRANKTEESIVIDNIENISAEKGVASKLLDEIIQAANAEGKELQLFPRPPKGGKLSKEQLTDWYIRKGFKMREDGIMVKKPEPLEGKPIWKLTQEESFKVNEDKDSGEGMKTHEEMTTDFLSGFKNGKSGLSIEGNNVVFRNSDGKPVGFAHFDKEGIREIGVDKSERGSGISTKMIDFLKKEKGIDKVLPPFSKEGNIIAHRNQVKKAIEEGRYQDAIDKGEMTLDEANKIIKSAKLQPLEGKGEVATVKTKEKKETAQSRAKKVYKDIGEIDEPSDVRGLALEYFAGGGKVKEESVNEVSGTVKRASLNTGAKEKKSSEVKARDYVSKDGKTVDEIAHSIWDNLPEELQDKISTRDLKNELEDVINSHNTRLSAATEFRDRYILSDVKENLTDAEIKEIEDIDIARRSKIVEGLPENQQKELIQLIEKYEDKYGNVDWERLEKDTNGFEPDILSLSIETQNALDAIIKKNISEAASKSDNIADKDGASKKEKAEERLTTAQSNYNKAAAELKKAEDKISQTQATQSEMFDATQKEMFGVDRDAAKKILDPLRQKVKETKSELEAAQKAFGNITEQPKLELNEEKPTVKEGEQSTTEDTGNESKLTKGDQIKQKVKSAANEVRNALRDFQNLGAVFNPKDQAQKNKRLTDALVNYVKAKLEEGAYAVSEFIQDIKNLFGIDIDQEGADYIFDESKKSEPPPTPPKEEKTENGKGQSKEKGILNKMHKAKKVPEAAKKGFEEEGLEYETKSQEEAQGVAKAVIDSFGIDEAVRLAKEQTFDGDVNSLIFGEALGRLSELEEQAKTEEEAFEQANKFAEIGIEYDKMARYAGRFNAAINYFYKKSPLGIVIMENAKRKNAFNEWSKPKDKSWRESFDELMKNPEFKVIVDEKVQEQLKKERQSSRASRLKKVRSIFASAKEKVRKSGMAYTVVIPPHIAEAALEAMELAYESGEAVAKIIGDAIDYISKKLGRDDWDKDKFRKEWETTLVEKPSGKKVLTDEEIKAKVLDKFRKKLKGLSEKQQIQVIQRFHKQIIENGGLDYDDFKKIIASVLGRGELTSEQVAKMKELVKKTNDVEEVAKELREKRTPELFKKFREAEHIAGKAAKELNTLFYDKPDIVQRLVSIAQLSTLGATALIANVVYNIWNQAALRFPIGLVNSLIDAGASAYAKDFGKTSEQEYNILDGQVEFWNKLGLGSKESIKQVFNGLNRMDYTQKEVYGQRIRPARSWVDLMSYFKGKKPLTTAQFWDKIIQGTVGVPAEIVARLLNVGDKPLRFAAEGGQAAVFAKTLGLVDMDYKLFVEFPREEAYRAYKAQGLSDEEAGKKADYVKEAIIKEGQRATFQQDNLLNDIITRGASVLGGKNTGTANLAKTLVVSPYIKIPSNAFWSFYNIANPEIAFLQAIVHGQRAKSLNKKGETVKAKLAQRESRYWLAHGIVGIGTRAAILYLASQGKFNPEPDDDDSKKEREATSFFNRGGTTNINGFQVSNRWMGPWGMLGNLIAKKEKNMTQEQRDNQSLFWNIMFGGMEVSALSELESGVFSNSSSLLQSLNSGDWSRYGMNTLNLMANIIQPAAISQLNNAALDYVPTSKGDSFLDKLNQNFARRSTLYRNVFNVNMNYKRDIWGERIPKGGNVISRAFGISKVNPQLFGRILYDDYLRTNDSGFLPPTVLPTLNDKKLNQKQHDKLQEYIGNERKRLVEPYINDMSKIPGFSKTYSELKTDDNKKFVLGYLYSRGRELGLAKFYKDYPEFEPTKDQKNFEDEIQRDLFKSIIQIENLK